MYNTFNIQKYNQEISYFPTRMLAVQTFYSINIKKKIHEINIESKILIEESINFFYNNYNENYNSKNLNKEIFEKIIFTVLKNKCIVDTFLEKNINNKWSIKRIAPIIYSILSCSICENMILQYSFKKLLINDYLQISKSLGYKNEIGFINKILHKSM